VTRNRFALGGAALIASLAILAGACGDDNGDDDAGTVQPTPTASLAGGSVPSSGSVAPNTFLTYDGERYRLVDLQQADLVDESEFEELGEASQADIDQDDLTVYRKADDADAVYTYSEPVESEVVGEGSPGLWYRWTPEPQN
jgi:hypothetical protein